jgi:hypothetical protein
LKRSPPKTIPENLTRKANRRSGGKSNLIIAHIKHQELDLTEFPFWYEKDYNMSQWICFRDDIIFINCKVLL